MIYLKRYLKLMALFLLAIMLFTYCDNKKEEDNPVPVEPTSLIVAGSRVGHYVVVNPDNGLDRVEVAPQVQTLERVVLGYQSYKVLIMSPPGAGTGIHVIFSADRATGFNLIKLTSENDYNVIDVDGSPVAARVAYSARDNVNNYLNIYTMNEDGSGKAQLSFHEEGVECPTKVATKLVGATFPAWSPDGSKIVFDGYLREVVTNHPHNAIIIMDSDGSNKTVVYSQPVEETWYRDISWCPDGQYLFFSLADGKRMVKALHIGTGNVSDLTVFLEVGGTEVENLWTSPNSSKLVYNLKVPGGGDLYTVTYQAIQGDFMTITGNPVMLTQPNIGHGYAQPDWQLYDGN